MVSIGLLGAAREGLHELFKRGKHEIELIDMVLGKHFYDETWIPILITFTECQLPDQQF